MGTFIIPDIPETDFLDLLTAVDYRLRLYLGDMVTGQTGAQLEALTAADFTEATFAGYANQLLTGGAWSITEGDPSVAVYAAQTFTRSSTGAPESVFGHYVTRESDDTLQWFEQYDGPIIFEFGSDTADVAPELTLDDQQGGGGVDTGVIAPYGGAAAPDGTLLCDGAAVSRTTYATLFAVVGTAYGAGNGSTTFNVPNMVGRFPLGKASSGTGATLGATGGVIDHEHTLDHDRAYAEIYAATTPNDWMYMRRVTNTLAPYDLNYRTQSVVNDAAIGAGATAGVGLQGDTDGNNPPFQVCNYIIYT